MGTERTDRLEAADRLGSLIQKLSKVFSASTREWVAGSGLEASGFRVLAELVIQGPARTGALADALHADASTISRQVGALVKVGFASTDQDPEDRRVSIVTATEDGQLRFEEARARRNQLLAGLVSDWPDHDLEVLLSLLDRLTADVEPPRVPALPRKVSALTDPA